MVKKYKSNKNWESKNFDTIIDVRSPSEFANDHIIGAINCPVLSDQEREKVGTIYKKESTFKAKIIGSSLTARNIADHIEKNFLEQKGSWQPLVYCWRGGQRSKSFSIILSEVVWRTYQLDGGYKEYRNSVVKFFENIGSKLKIILSIISEISFFVFDPLNFIRYFLRRKTLSCCFDGLYFSI